MEPEARTPTLPWNVLYFWNKAVKWVIYNTDQTCMPKTYFVCESCSNFLFAVHLRYSVSYTKLRFEKLYLMKTISWKFKTALLKLWDVHQHTVRKHFNQPHQIRYINNEKSVLLPLHWDKNVLLFTKRLHMMNKIICYS